MIDCFYSKPSDLRRLRSGPLGPHIERFAALLAVQGYCKWSARRKIRLVAALNRWLVRNHLQATELNEARVRSFLNAQWRRVLRLDGDEATLALFLRQLRQAGIVAPVLATTAQSPSEVLERDYKRFLIQERGLTEATVGAYARITRGFLLHRFPNGQFHLDQLSPEAINQFILDQTKTCGRKWVQLTASVLRSFLGFLYEHGRLATNLAGAVPTVAGWRLSELPRFLETQEVERLLRCADQKGEVGWRDYAILLLLARLGLRAGEIVHLNLEDINWQAGELRIRGKGARVDRVPLVRDVGQALATYLEKGRPKCSVRQVFIRITAPRHGLSHSATVDEIVDRALHRAKLQPHHRGAHLLRHSLATRMIRAGASLAEIGEILRHQHPQTTEIYAKVDLGALRALAQPWPGAVR